MDCAEPSSDDKSSEVIRFNNNTYVVKCTHRVENYPLELFRVDLVWSDSN